MNRASTIVGKDCQLPEAISRSNGDDVVQTVISRKLRIVKGIDCVVSGVGHKEDTGPVHSLNGVKNRV
jgi:hypothetical protein